MVSISDSENYTVAAGEFHFCQAMWRCEQHGQTNAVLHLRLHSGHLDRTYCLACLVDALEKLGLQSLIAEHAE